MSQPILEYSEERIGQVWSDTDHLYLMRVIHEIEWTATEMLKAAHPITETDFPRAIGGHS